MTEKEFRKLGMEDLVEILMVQNDEVLRLQGELDRRKEELTSYTKRNDTLKASLNDRDAETEILKEKLNERDARIHELETEIEVSKADQWIALEEMGSIAEAARNLDVVFAEAQKNAEFYLKELMEEVNPGEETAGTKPWRRLSGERIETGYLDDTEESIEDIERRYLGYGEEQFAEEIEDIERQYRGF